MFIITVRGKERRQATQNERGKTLLSDKSNIDEGKEKWNDKKSVRDDAERKTTFDGSKRVENNRFLSRSDC